MWLTIGILYIDPKRFLSSPGKPSGWKWTVGGKAETLEVKFSPLAIFRFPRWRTKKHEKRNFPHYLGVFEVEKNVFMNENFHFSTPTYFLISQDGGPINMKKGTLYMTRGFSRVRKPFLWIKIFIFSVQHIVMMR